MTRPSVIPNAAWPRRMNAAMSAAYCGEPSIEAFEKRIGVEYPAPRVNDGRRRLWLRDDLDLAIGAMEVDPEFRDASAEF